MMLNISKVDVWAARIDDRPGTVNGRLDPLAKAGANLEFILARREGTGAGVVFVTPLRGEAQVRAAQQAGFERSQALHALRVEAPDEPGLGYLITLGLAQAGINLRGLVATRVRDESVIYLAFDNADDADMALHRLERAL